MAALILRWQLLGLLNALRAALARDPRDLLTVSAAALLLAAYNFASCYESLLQAAPAIRAVWPRVAAAGAAAAFGAGLLFGRICARWAARVGQAPWLVVLPISGPVRAMAVRIVALAAGGALLPVPALCGWGISHAVGAGHGGIAGSAVALCFAVGFCGAAWPAARPATAGAPVQPSVPSMARVWRLIARLDAMAPCWAGLWAQGDGGRRLSSWWSASLVLGGGFALAISISQGSPWPSVVAGVVGGNLVFMVGLRGGPLASPVLRASGAAFGACWMAIARGPLALSLLWFCLCAMPAFGVSPGAWRAVLGAAVVLLALDGLFATALAVSVESFRRAQLLFAILLGAVLYQGAQYGMAYGALAALVAAGVCGLLWRQARRRFRTYG